jgi:hypothetical protein
MTDDVVIEAGGARVVLRPMTNRAKVRQYRVIQALSTAHPDLFDGKGDGLEDGLAWAFVQLVARAGETNGLNFPVPPVAEDTGAEIVAAYEAYLDDTNIELGEALALAVATTKERAAEAEPVDPNAESGARKGGKGLKADSAKPPAAA